MLSSARLRAVFIPFLLASFCGIAQANESKQMLAKIEEQLVKPKASGFEACKPGTLRTKDFVVLYFSAHWDHGSKEATPELVEFYEQAKKKHQNFEIVFISSDKDEKEMLRFMNGYKMPWLALKFKKQHDVDGLIKHAGRAIPSVAVLDAEGKLVAHSFEEKTGKYQGVLKPVEAMKRMLDSQSNRLVSMR
ncbi:MAG: thioredoxin-like domain-containing protein [Verrucomicrobiota bacterium]